ncbi:MAG TPA: DEAD/DEAH box helicase, partial [Gammaproteobacteria bacterium]|nr:DEAD/DEAH box helicase [Gammaproteobacteria bacterium]
ARVIPIVLQGHDVLAGAQTGTGKTAGFTLPLLQRLSASAPPEGRRRIRALILTPTRELAAQVEDSVRRYGKYVPLRSAVVFGGVNINPQVALLRRGVDVLVATPGRLLDHASQRNVDLGGVEIFVLDEADRMLDMGFLPDIRRVIALLPAKRQSLLFSATFPDDIRRLAGKLLHDPASIEVAAPNATADRIEQLVHHVEKKDKRSVLSHLIGDGDWRQVLVFTRTKHGANRLAHQLEDDGLTSAAIHGNKSQAARTRALADFKAGKVRVLVATDIAARGLDIDQLPHVVNFELPEVPEYYVHRIGRTGRAGREGVAVSLVSGDERPLLKAIERVVGQRIAVGPTPEFTPRQDAPRDSGSRDSRLRHDDGRNRHGRRHDTRREERTPQRDAGRKDYVNNVQGGSSERGRDDRRRDDARAEPASRNHRPAQPGNAHRGQHPGAPAQQHGRPHGQSRSARRRAGRAARQH